MRMKIKAVIFDMDGVIFDSEVLVLQSWKEVAALHGFTVEDELFFRCVGVNAANTKEIFLDYYGRDFPYDEYKTQASKWFHDRYDNGLLPMKPGVKELLTYLKDAGYFIGLASSTRKATVTQEITDAGLMPFFDNLTCGDMLKKSKPEPDIFWMACENLKVKPEEALVIEDSFNGIRAAYRAGCIPLMVPDMIAPDGEMKEKAFKIFENLFEVQKWMETQVSKET
ncbi:MAG: HAD family phosphatase [Lachnospiraceae bacterium]|nr:HAD family phosphatase [Lachnospiraceae bacterium]